MTGLRTGILLQTADEEVALEWLEKFGRLGRVGEGPVEGAADEDGQNTFEDEART